MQTFVSYAQNFEDVILWRALSHVENGFYVDVGAQHPLKDSVTRAFYERGWRGVNIDPVPAWQGLLAVDRPDDVNLQVAVGAAPGDAVFYEVDQTGLSTMDARLAARYSAEGRIVRMASVEVRTLDSIFAEFAPAQVHFLKIDVEGAESEVLSGLSLRRYRPWVVVVEATLPNTQQDVSGAWESLLSEAGYLPVYFDGLNRFFVAEEHGELQRHFVLPPNYFDGFVRHPDWEEAELARRLSEEKQAWLAEESSLNEQLEASRSHLEARERFWNEELAASQRQVAGLEEHLAGSEAALRSLRAEHDAAMSASESALRSLRAEHDAATYAREAALDEARRLHQEHSSVVEQFRRQLERSHGNADWLASQLRQRTHVLDRVLSSRSWRVTAPLRWLSSVLGAANPLDWESQRDPTSPAQLAEVKADGAREAFVGVPGERVLLDLASQRYVVARPDEHRGAEFGTVEVIEAPDEPMMHRFDQLMTEARMMLPPPQAVPPRMRSMPGMSFVAPYFLRVYERLFRRQAIFNAKMIEALQLLKDRKG